MFSKIFPTIICLFFKQSNLIFQIDGAFDGIIDLKPDLFNYKSIT